MPHFVYWKGIAYSELTLSMSVVSFKTFVWRDGCQRINKRTLFGTKMNAIFKRKQILENLFSKISEPKKTTPNNFKNKCRLRLVNHKVAHIIVSSQIHT